MSSDGAAADVSGAAAEQPHRLDKKWTFWFDNVSKPKQGAAWGNNLRDAYTFDTVEEFWCLYDHVFKPSKLPGNADFHLFKAGIEPKWEDPQCANGGKWMVTSSRKAGLETMWLETLMALIGEQFEDADEICGVVASVRQRQDKLSLWTKNAANEAAQMSIGRKWKEIIDVTDKITYNFHVNLSHLAFYLVSHFIYGSLFLAPCFTNGLGACKFGFCEFFKKYYDIAGPEYATKYKTLIYLVGSASAEVIADMALCPMEAVKVRVQTQPGFARGLGDGLPKFVRSDGVLGRNLVYAVNQDAEDAFKKSVELDRLIDMLKNASDREGCLIISASNLQDNIAGQQFSASFSAQSGAPSPVFQHSGSMQGLHNIHGSFNVPNMSRNSTMANVPSSGLQQPSGNLSSGRFTSNISGPLSQISHGNSHGYPGLANRGGPGGMGVGNPGFSSGLNAAGSSIPGILPTSATIGNRINTGGVPPVLGNSGQRMSSLAGNIIGSGNVGRGLTTGGGLSLPGLSSRLSLNTNSGPGTVGVQGSNRLMGGMFQQASPQVMSMLGNSYHSGGPLSQNHVNSMGMMNDMNNNDGSPFDINDFPQLSSRPGSSGGAHGQIGSLRKQGLGVSPIVQQNQEFSIQNEDFPALPGFKGGNADYSIDLHQKEQLRDNNASMVQSPHFSMGRSSGFNLGGTFSSHHPHQQSSNQDPHHLHGSDMFQGSHSSYHSQASGPPGVGLRHINSLNTISGVGSFDQLMPHYPPQQIQSQSQFRLQQLSGAGQSYRDQGIKSMQAGQTAPDRFGLLGLLGVIRMSDPDLTSIALGIDLTTLGLNLNSAENLHKTFGSPWTDEPVKGDPDFTVPQCYYSKQAPALNQRLFSKFQLNTLFYIFYSMPKDEAQLYAANELYNRSWFYHREHRLWFMRSPNMEPLVKTDAYERGSYVCFDPNTWETIRKENFVIYYEMLDKRPAVPQH
ncbi:hypothetical protein SSX86_024810 [Deinandra increscens subsp. villosa]|uniref:mRNA cap-binding protein n=1 Tax=Deinandra increscens subsp. villosa TaxID=3103831 RepID=A0AAP0CD27_9ASTR